MSRRRHKPAASLQTQHDDIHCSPRGQRRYGRCHPARPRRSVLKSSLQAHRGGDCQSCQSFGKKKGKKNKNPKGRAADVTRFAPQQRPPAHCKSPPHGAGQSVRQSGNNSTRHRKRPKCVASLRPDLFEAWKRAARFL